MEGPTWWQEYCLKNRRESAKMVFDQLAEAGRKHGEILARRKQAQDAKNLPETR
jgi:hypothetical protein